MSKNHCPMSLRPVSLAWHKWTFLISLWPHLLLSPHVLWALPDKSTAFLKWATCLHLSRPLLMPRLEWLWWSGTSAWGERGALGLICEAQEAQSGLRMRFLFKVSFLAIRAWPDRDGVSSRGFLVSGTSADSSILSHVTLGEIGQRRWILAAVLFLFLPFKNKNNFYPLIIDMLHHDYRKFKQYWKVQRKTQINVTKYPTSKNILSNVLPDISLRLRGK